MTTAPDWAAIEAAYRLGDRSLRQLADEFGNVNHVAIARRAKKEGWTKDLRPKILARAEEMMQQHGGVTTPAVTKERNEVTPAEAAAIERGAATVFQTRMSHKAKAARLMGIFEKLAAELEGETHDPAGLKNLADLAEALANGKDKDDVIKLFRAATSMPGRIESLKRLTETFEKLVRLERVAYGLDNIADEPQSTGSVSVGNDLARRLAFVLSRAIKNQPQGA